MSLGRVKPLADVTCRRTFRHSELCILDAATGLPARSAIDTVERFQGGERTLILGSATE
jgi:hypothetical protein